MSEVLSANEDARVTDPEVEAAAKALVTAKGTNPMTLFQINVFTGTETFDLEDDVGRRFIYSWRKQLDYARAALVAAAAIRTTKPTPEGQEMDVRLCTCHPDDNPPVPCARKYALSDCRLAPTDPA